MEIPKIAGTYQAVIRVKIVAVEQQAESKQEAIRLMLLDLGSRKDRTSFEDWVNGGMETELKTTLS